MNISLDGYCDHTLFNPSEELYDYFTAMMDDVDLLFFGRVMYQLMFPYWAEVAENRSGSAGEAKFAERFTAIDKVVVSRTLDNKKENARIVRSNPAIELFELKKQSGKKISVDSLSMLPELVAANLIDEFNLVVHPIIAGNGRLLFDKGSLAEKLNLNLAGTQTFQNGCIALHYNY
jgi:dihydrofolate reductase